MKADMKAALAELAKAHDELSTSIGQLNDAHGLGEFVGVKQARERVATTAYLVDKAYRPKHYAKIEEWKKR